MLEIELYTQIVKVTTSPFIYWLPRVLGVVFILFLMIFSLDVFESGRTAGEIVIGLFMHNIPALILLTTLIIAWKHELVGAISFTLGGLLYIVLLSTSSNFQWYMITWSLFISGPAFLIGGLFAYQWINKRKKTK